jgi:hypothetical protein
MTRPFLGRAVAASRAVLFIALVSACSAILGVEEIPPAGKFPTDSGGKTCAQQEKERNTLCAKALEQCSMPIFFCDPSTNLSFCECPAEGGSSSGFDGGVPVCLMPGITCGSGSSSSFGGSSSGGGSSFGGSSSGGGSSSAGSTSGGATVGGTMGGGSTAGGSTVGGSPDGSAD